MAADPILMSHQEQVCRAELARLINSMPFAAPAAVTLTMKKRHGARLADDIVASENFRHFRNRLEHSLLGSAAKLHGKHLMMIVVLETSADNRLHYHCIIDRPYHCTLVRFEVVVREEWTKTDFGYRHIDIQDQPDEGWTYYILKQRQKRSLFDSIDWANCQLIAE
ncbi:hypothetical protein [Bradyrhizobium sp. B117]|uniref:rolling circle replication-associated protein n=1 Tax=Bradyrhizobium sp. B117 TaxID=3140246 RepID=UPI003183C11F